MYIGVKRMMKRIFGVCVLLFCLLGAAALADPAGIWSYTNGSKVHGDGFVLNADGTGEWLETLVNNYTPAYKFLRTGKTFTWKTVQEGEAQFLVETVPDGGERRFALTGTAPTIYLTDGSEKGEYYRLNNTEKVVLANDRLDIITKLEAIKGKFPTNKRYNVYQGPGVEYGRSGGGKGVVSTNGPIYCYGTRNGYLLIEYEISKNKHRFGWVKLTDLSGSQLGDAFKLDFSRDGLGYTCGVLTQDAMLTDDPFYSQNAIADFPAGTSVFVLMREKDYLLVEGFVGKQMHMGFVPADIVEMKYGYAENVRHTIDKAETYSEEDIHAAMEAVEEAVRQHFSGTSVLEIKYIEAESADPTDWWQPEEEHREGMQLFADLNGMSFYEGEIAAYGVAKDYGFNVYRDKDGGAWEVCNWGYE